MKLFSKNKKQLDIIQAKHQDISFEINNKLQITNVTFQKTHTILKLGFFDNLPQIISKRLIKEGIFYNPKIFNQINKLTYNLSFKQTKKTFIVFARTHWEIDKIQFNLVVIFKIINNLIIINTRIATNKAIYYGISLKMVFLKPLSFFKSDAIESQNKIINFPFQKQEYIHFPDIANEVKFQKCILHIQTTLVSNTLEANHFICSPIIWGQKRQIINSWKIRPNKITNTFNTIKLEFKENGERK